MVSDSVGILPIDEDSSDEEMRCTVPDTMEEEERNMVSFPPSLFTTVHAPFRSLSPITEEKSDFFSNCLW